MGEYLPVKESDVIKRKIEAVESMRKVELLPLFRARLKTNHIQRQKNIYFTDGLPYNMIEWAMRRGYYELAKIWSEKKTVSRYE